MISLSNAVVFGWHSAIMGMRNPMNSWPKSDSVFYNDFSCKIGQNDLDLMKKLIKAGAEHRKFLRMLHVQMDIEAPLYWWKEFETYKIGTVSNSCSTMHKIAAKEFDVNDFSHEHIEELDGDEYNMSYDWLLRTVDILNYYRKKYNTASEKLNRDITDAERKHILAQRKLFWWQMIQLLPSSYNQLRTVDLNYEVLLNQYFQRKDHKLDEWRIYCEQIKCFPYLNDFIEVLKNEQ